MTDREVLDLREMMESEAEAQHWKCPACGGPLVGKTPQWAHIISQSKQNLRKYGAAVIHHRVNGFVVCSLECNDAVALGDEPIAEAALIEKIRRANEGD